MEAPPDRSRGGADLEIASVGPEDRTLVQRLRSGSDRLFAAGLIDGAAWNAGAKWRGDCEFGLHGASAPDKKSGDGDGDYEGARLNALTRYRRACEAVGRHGVTMLTLFELEC